MSEQKDWDDYARRYAPSLIGPYHTHRLAVIRDVISRGGGVRVADRASTVDFGCGDGILLEGLLGQLCGIDISHEMIALARRRLGGDVELKAGGVEALGNVSGGSVDLLIAANVIAYLERSEEARFYSEARRILRPGGRLIAVHSNSLFDMYSLNYFTKEFFAAEFGVDVESLLTSTEKPERENWFSIRENPLSYGEKLRDLGFREQRQEYINFHDRPPPLESPSHWADLDAKGFRSTLDVPCGDRWKLLFQCSQFVSESVLA